MRSLILALAVLSLAFTQEQMPPPNPHPLPGHGRYENVPGVRCYKGDTDAAYRLVHCACQRFCDGHEDRTCETSCGHGQCVCHADSDECDGVMPEEPR